MDESMVANGIVMGLFGGLFILVVPLAVALFVGGLILFSLGFFFPPRSEIQPRPGYEFCEWCAEEFPVSAERCPACTAPNHRTALK